VVARDAWDAKRFVDKLRVWFMPTGWRPEGARPLPKGEWKRDGHELKFQSTQLKGSKPYLVLQVALGFPAMLLVTRTDTPLDTLERVLLSLVLWAAATTWAGLLESKRWAVRAEVLRLVAQAALLFSFHARALVPGPWLLAGAVACLASAAWALTLRSEPQEPALAMPTT
jgi:hypothetical protein